MRITIVMGFFLPVPPVRGGATEKSWDRLARLLAERGHEVTVISRRWPGWADEETRDGVLHLRIGGFNHRRTLGLNLALDAVWSLRVTRQLPAADIAIVHAVTLPLLLRGRLRKRSKLVLMPGRMPKGQYRLYRNVDRVLATSCVVRDQIVRENASLAPNIRVVGYPIDCSALSGMRREKAATAPITIGYVGRLHPEKGVGLLAEAAVRLQATAGLPDWELTLCGPTEVSAGGGGPEYIAGIRALLSENLPAGRWRIEPPCFQGDELAKLYCSIDVLCYPSLAAQGETFGVAVAEAMAAGAVPVVSSLACFRDLVEDGVSGRVFDHEGRDPAGRLAEVIASLLRETPDARMKMQAAASAVAHRYDFPRYADSLVADLESLLATEAETARKA